MAMTAMRVRMLSLKLVSAAAEYRRERSEETHRAYVEAENEFVDGVARLEQRAIDAERRVKMEELAGELDAIALRAARAGRYEDATTLSVASHALRDLAEEGWD